MNQDFIKKIKQLKKIEPSREWLDSTRSNLVAQFEPEIGFFQWLKQPQSFALAFCSLLIILGGPWLTLQASKSSLPGELLYSVKKANEGLQMTVASDNNKTQLRVEFASRRLEELNKIAEDWQKSEQIKKVASELKDDLNEASVYADKISEENIIAVVKKANKIKEELGENKESMSSEAQIELVEAEKAVEEINRQILTALIKDKESGEGSATTTDQEILIFLEELDDGSVTTTDRVINGE